MRESIYMFSRRENITVRLGPALGGGAHPHRIEIGSTPSAFFQKEKAVF